MDPPAVAADLGEFVQAALGVLDLVARGEIDRRFEGDIDHILADIDQFAPGREVVDRASVIHRIDDGRCFGCETGKVLGKRQPGDVDLGGQKRLQGHRGGELARANQAARYVVDLLMDRLEEMRWLEKITDAVKRLVVDEDRTQKRLLRFDVVRCGTVGRRRLSCLLARCRIEGCHDAERIAFQSVERVAHLHPPPIQGDRSLLLSPLLTARK